MVGYAFYHIFNNVFVTEVDDHFQAFLIKLFDIKLPESWEMWTLPDPFLAVFPKPSLLTTRVTKNGIIPMDTSSLSLRPTFTRTSDGKEPLFPSDNIYLFMEQIHLLEKTH